MNYKTQNAAFRRPWIKYYDESTPADLEYYEGTMYQRLSDNASEFPDCIALDYMDAHITYKELHELVLTAAASFRSLRIGKGDCVTICLPNIPQAVIAFYACQAVGAIANMIHPLSATPEIEYAIDVTQSSILMILDAFYSKAANLTNASLKHIVVAGADTYMPFLLRTGFKLTRGRKIKKITDDVIRWKPFLERGFKYKDSHDSTESSLIDGMATCDDVAVILYSGGTTGKQKGIMLSHLNFNALATQTISCGAQGVVRGDTILAVLPMFHGFGLGVCVHTAIFYGMTSILVPQFTADSFAKIIVKKKPAFIAGVPTLYEALLKNGRLDKADMSGAKGVFSGGDSLPHDIKMRFDELLKSKGSKVLLREGFGLTECVTASCLTPPVEYRRGSVGIPYSDMLYKVVIPNTCEEAAVETDGELCVSGPTVMIGYLNDPEETQEVLKVHADGRKWLHTGDMGYMDADGFVYFKSRIKRMVKCSGYSVYPSQVEDLLNSHEAVSISCVIGVPDPYKMHRLRAFVVLKEGYYPSDALAAELREYCIERIARYSVPKEILFRDSLPMTKVGKVAYTELEKET